jgi:hypothetical protein
MSWMREVTTGSTEIGMCWVGLAGAATAVVGVVTAAAAVTVWVPELRKPPAVEIAIGRPPAVDGRTGDDFDLDVKAGDSFTIHEPSTGTLVRFVIPSGWNVRDECSVEPVLGIPSDIVHKMFPETARNTMFVPVGSWSYRVECVVRGHSGERRVHVVEGHITALHDDGRLQLGSIQHKLPTSPIVIEEPAAGAPWNPHGTFAIGHMAPGWYSEEYDRRCAAGIPCHFDVYWNNARRRHVLTFDAPDGGGRHYFVLRAPPT